MAMSVHNMHVAFFLLLHIAVSCTWNVIVHPTTLISSITFLAFFFYFFNISNIKKTKGEIFIKEERGKGIEICICSLQNFGCGLLMSPLNISVRVITHIHDYYIGYSWVGLVCRIHHVPFISYL
jgi:ABC-type uncharacterized transport system permease subunit